MLLREHINFNHIASKNASIFPRYFNEKQQRKLMYKITNTLQWNKKGETKSCNSPFYFMKKAFRHPNEKKSTMPGSEITYDFQRGNQLPRIIYPPLPRPNCCIHTNRISPYLLRILIMPILQSECTILFSIYLQNDDKIFPWGCIPLFFQMYFERQRVRSFSTKEVCFQTI